MVYSVWSLIYPFTSRCSRLCPNTIMCIQVSRVLSNCGFKDAACDGNVKCRICSGIEPISSSSDPQDWFGNETITGKLDSWNVLMQLRNFYPCDWNVVVIRKRVFSSHTVFYQLYVLYPGFGGCQGLFALTLSQAREILQYEHKRWVKSHWISDLCEKALSFPGFIPGAGAKVTHQDVVDWYMRKAELILFPLLLPLFPMAVLGSQG